ncbi:hypothetical protein [Roseovarius pacificus]|uniref:hypothetical protein n=1 Tax=Roseovarius pacificus TaxID=337701 RepID=UPI00403989D5
MLWLISGAKWLTTSVVGRWLIAILAVIAIAAWLRWDAGQDVRRDIEADSNAARIEHRETSEREKDDVESISADDLLRELLGRLSGPDSD